MQGGTLHQAVHPIMSVPCLQNIWRQDDGSVSSMQSIDSELGGMVRDSSMDSRLDSRLSGGSTQSDLPRGPRKKKKGLMGKLRSLTKSSRNSESEISVGDPKREISYLESYSISLLLPYRFKDLTRTSALPATCVRARRICAAGSRACSSAPARTHAARAPSVPAPSSDPSLSLSSAIPMGHNHANHRQPIHLPPSPYVR